MLEETSQPAADSPQAANDYVVVARRYRPQQFEELIGQEHVASALANAIDTHRIGHAYLFTGARGVGKTSAARILAKALNCVQGPTPRPCGTCEICRDVASGDDVDVLEIDGASNRGIDEIRQLRQNVNIRPSRATFKIYIIDEVHMLTREAFNALLKTLEEPPEHVKFIFCTTEPNKIPITVLSRCQRFDFAGIRTESIERRLAQIVESEGLEADPEALAILARRAAGSMRDSQSLLEQLLASCDKRLTAEGVHALLGTADDLRLADLAERVMRGDAAAALAALDGALAAAIDVGQLLEQLLGVFRDCMAAKVGCDDAQLYALSTRESRQRVRDLAEQASLEKIMAMLQILDQALARFRVTTQRRTLAEIALVRLCHLDDLEELSALLSQLSGGGPVNLPAGSGQPPAARARDVSPEAVPRSGTERASAAEGRGGSQPSLSADFAAAKQSTPPPARGEFPPEQAADREETGGGAATAVLDPPAPRPDRETPRLTAENCVRVWQSALSELGGLLADAAESSTAAILAPNRLAVTFPQAYNKALCEQAENLTKIKQALARIGHHAVELDFQVSEPASEQASPPQAAPPETVSQHRKIFEVSEHPLVKQAEELFGATVQRVD